jgi:DNA-binding NtrC family response regulator
MESILIVDDEPDICWALENILKEKGVVSQKTLSGRGALKLIESDSFQLALVDVKLPDMEGIEVARQIREVAPAIRIVMISGYSRREDAYIQRALVEGLICGFIAKPFLNDEILKALEFARSADPPSHKVM